MRLKEFLEYLYELSSKGLSQLSVFDQAFDLYLERLFLEPDNIEKRQAKDFLEDLEKEGRGIGDLNLGFILDQLG